jgi:hypothetical protein
MKGKFQIPSTKSQTESKLPKKKFKEDFFESWVLGIGACTLFGIWNLKFGACGLMPSPSAFRDLAWPNFFLLNRRSIC